MSTLHVTFMGICTHIWETQPTSNPVWGHRIVVPNASSPAVINAINGFYGLNNAPNTPIAPHVASLGLLVEQFDHKEGPLELTPGPNDTLVARLEGVFVTVPNDATGELQKDARCMPGLGSFVEEIAPGDMALSSSSALASCYFDFATGTVWGRALQNSGGAGAILYISEPDLAPTITVVPFDGSQSTTFFLKEDVPDNPLTVRIGNLPESGIDDNDNDFVLHYLVANKFPPAIPRIGPMTCIQHPEGQLLLERFGPADLGPGCSASNLP